MEFTSSFTFLLDIPYKCNTTHCMFLIIMQYTFNRAKKVRCSRTVSLLNNTLCCGHSPRLSLTPSISLIMLCPLMMALPLVGGNSPTSMDIVVVLPAPL